ncbi:MAG: HAD family hydrolase [Cyanobacteria bacterium]|nr:HAD family hydrolase [Cyanobacteriota bacterium]
MPQTQEPQGSSATPLQQKQIAVFLDRDGTLNEEKGYLRQVDDLVLLPGAANAIRRLNDAGILTVLTTNQTGPARGFYGEDHVLALNKRLVSLLEKEGGAHLDAIYYCPHLAKGSVPEYALECDCRKPQTGMIDKACTAFPGINRELSYVLGDKASDVEFGHNAGCKTFLLKTGYGTRVLEGKYQVLSTKPTYVADSVVEAVDLILQSV